MPNLGPGGTYRGGSGNWSRGVGGSGGGVGGDGVVVADVGRRVVPDWDALLERGRASKLQPVMVGVPDRDPIEDIA